MDSKKNQQPLEKIAKLG
jgi:hypothetical protein